MIPSAIKVAPFLRARDKRRSVSTTIAEYAQMHAAADVGMTLATCWLPGGGLIAMAGAMAIQAPLVYKPLARQIAKNYLVSNVDAEVQAAINETAIEGAEWDVAGEFGIEFFKEIISEILTEIGLGAVLGAIPFIGSGVAIWYDRKIAATLTWRVGVSIALYYENGCEWIVDRKTTYEKAHSLVTGGLSANTTDRCNLDSFSRQVPGLRDRQASLLLQYLDLGKRITGIDALEHMLRQQLQVDSDLIDAVLTEVRRRRVIDGRPSAAARERYVRCTACGENHLREEQTCPHCYRTDHRQRPSPVALTSRPTSERAQISVRLLRAAGLNEDRIFQKCVQDFGLSPSEARAAMAF